MERLNYMNKGHIKKLLWSKVISNFGTTLILCVSSILMAITCGYVSTVEANAQNIIVLTSFFITLSVILFISMIKCIINGYFGVKYDSYSLRNVECFDKKTKVHRRHSDNYIYYSIHGITGKVKCSDEEYGKIHIGDKVTLLHRGFKLPFDNSTEYILL